MRVVIDTHVLAWSLIKPALLPQKCIKMLKSGINVLVAPCSLHEICLKVRKGEWDAMAPHADQLDGLCAAQGFAIAPYTARMATIAGGLNWDHLDPFDRMIAATAAEMSAKLMSKDAAFDTIPGPARWQGRVWD